MKGKVLVWLLAILPGIGLAQEPTGQAIDTGKTRHEFSVQQAIDFAMKNNVQVKNALLDVSLQEQVNREITSRAYPSINGNLSTTYNPNIATQVIPNFISPATYQVLVDEGVQGSGGPIVMPSDFGFIAAQFGTKYSANVGVSLSQILFDGQVFVGLQARGATIDFAKKNVEVTQEQIKSNIHKIYYQLVAGETQVELLDSNIARTGRLLRDTRIIYDNGFAEQLDVDRVSVQLSNLQTQRTQVVNTISNGYYGLKVLLGMPVNHELVLTDTVSDQQLRDGILENLAYSYTDRKDFQSAEIGKKLNEFNVRRYKLSQIPTVSLNGQYAKNAQRNEWNFFGKGEWFTISSVSLNVSIPIFNGFFTKSKIQQARIELQKTENQIEALKLSIDSEVATSKNNFTAAISQMDAQRRNMELATKVYNQTRIKYEEGIGTQLEITIAQNDLQAAQTNYINSMYNAIIARIDFLTATGKL
jgi:outer membrane protein TolC